MTDTHSERPSSLDQTADKANQIWGDLIPVLGFIGVYNVLRVLKLENELLSRDNAIFWATGVLIVLMVGVIVWKRVKREPVSLFMLVSAGIVGGFGILGIALQDKSFIYVKPTIQQLFLAALIFGSLALGTNIWKVMFQSVFDLPDFAWRTLAMRWGGYFIAMALWNEYLWRMYVPGFESPVTLAGIPVAPAGTYEFLGLTFGSKDAEDVWANWKLGNMAITLVFAMANVPYTLKHLRENQPDRGASA